MEALTAEAFKALLFIIPGIISLRIKAALAISSPSNPFLVAELPSYAWVVTLASFASAIGQSPTATGEIGRLFSEAGGFPIILIAVVVGFVAGWIRYHGWDFRLLRVLKITNRSGENLVWAEILTKAPASYAVVACRDGSRFMGWIDTFSEEAGNYELFLSRAFQVQDDGTALPVRGPGVLLTRENPIIRVELWDPV